jgi:hypothetical protein
MHINMHGGFTHGSHLIFSIGERLMVTRFRMHAASFEIKTRSVKPGLSGAKMAVGRRSASLEISHRRVP